MRPNSRRARPAVAVLATLVTAAGLLGSCTEAGLEEIPAVALQRDDELRVSGELCTREPETLVFPLRVLFIVDSSTSMEITDPPDPVTGDTGRERAVRQTWTRLLDQGPEGVRVGVVRFSAQAKSETAVDQDGDGLPDTYFTADRTRLEVATDALSQTDRTTNYVNALGEAYFEMRTELLSADQESLPLSKYVVVFISDGVPDVDSADARDTSRQLILESVGALRDLADNFRVGDFSFHAAYLATGQQALDQEAEELLKAMADTGGGNFRSFPNGEELNFLHVDFTVLRRLFTLKALAAVNLNTVVDHRQIPAAFGDGGGDSLLSQVSDLAYRMRGVPPETLYVDLDDSGGLECGEPMVDSDADGLSDLAEYEAETDPLVADTDDDGLGDALEWRFRDSGLDPLDPSDSQCYIAAACEDDDGDGVCACISDADADGVCDCVGDPDQRCVDPAGLDCVDADADGWCDCPDFDADGRCDYADGDGDGLHDCEEVFYGTAQNGADSDADGLPDPIEVRFGTNPADDDRLDDLDSDRTPNAIEVLANTNPACDDAAMRSRRAFRYALAERGIDGSKTCYDFDIGNVTLVPTLQSRAGAPVSGGPGDGWNRVLLFAGEVAFDDPQSFASYRVACVTAAYNPEGNYKNPPSGRVRLSEADFVDVSEFDEEVHCEAP